MKIKGQIVTESDSSISFTLNRPYWSAWQRYGWTQGIPGFGISKDIVDKAHKKGKKIIVRVDNAEYEITTTKIQKALDLYNSEFTTSKGIVLYVIPRDIFLKREILGRPISTYNAFMNMPDHIREEIRAKLK